MERFFWVNNFAKVCAVISNAAPESCEIFFLIFELFAEAHKLMTRKKLTDMEIQILKQHCYKFGELYPVFFPE